MEETKDEKEIRLTTKIIHKIHATNLPSDLKQEFIFFCLSYPMSDKHTNVFLNVIKGKAATIAYLYRHLMRVAVKMHVPRVYISEYYEYKDRIKNKWYNTQEYDKKMREASFILLRATKQMDKFLNSRLMKIKKLKELIEIKELEERKADN